MKLKLKLHDITELPGGVIRLAFEGPQGPHTIIHAMTEDCPEFIGLAKEDFGAEAEIEVLMANREPQAVNATPPPAPPRAETGTQPPETVSEQTTGAPTTGEPAGSGVFLTRTCDLPVPTLIGPAIQGTGDVFGHTTNPLPRVQAPAGGDEAPDAGIPDDNAPEAQTEDLAK
jgi:hypothetical protein